MPESIESYFDRIRAAFGEDGRLPVGVEAMPGWDIFPYELDSLRMREIEPLADAEEPRHGEDPAQCHCATVHTPDASTRVWTGREFTVDLVEASGLPIMLVLASVEHFDLADLPMHLAARLGQTIVTIAAAMESLPSVGRAQVGRYGDGGAHLHVFLMARPARMPQLSGSPLLDWEENLPRVPLQVLQDNARPIGAALVEAFGGRAGNFPVR